MLMNSAPTFCSTAAENAVSSSRSVLAVITCSRRPSACAAACRSRVSGSALGLFGFTSNASTAGRGHGLAHQLQPFGAEHVHEIGHAGDVAAGPAETRYQPDLKLVLLGSSIDKLICRQLCPFRSAKPGFRIT